MTNDRTSDLDVIKIISTSLCRFGGNNLDQVGDLPSFGTSTRVCGRGWVDGVVCVSLSLSFLEGEFYSGLRF